MKKLRYIVCLFLSIMMVTMLVGCSGSAQEETTIEETTEEPTTTLSNDEAISIAEEELASRLDGDEYIYDWELYKDSKVEGANIIDDSEEIIEVDMFAHVEFDWTFMGGTITAQKRLYACGINKYTGEVVKKEPEHFWKEQDQ